LNQVISLYDKTGDGLVPWAAEGFECFAYHPLCRNPSIVRAFDGPGSISFVQLEQDEMFKDLAWNPVGMARLVSQHRDKTAFLMAFPPGEALSTGGARWWRQKFVADPDFQLKAMDVVKECSHVARALGNVPFYIENPVGVLSRLWREPDHVFEPFQFGGYLPDDDVHPHWPDFLPPQDAYRRKICLWTGHDFKMPAEMSVSPKRKVYGKRAPRISRRVIPRGFSRAVFLANHGR